MARYNLKINYQIVRDIANEAKSLSEAAVTVENEIKNLSKVIESNSGKAMSALKQSTPELETGLEKFSEGLDQLGNVFNEFADNMLGIISYGDGGINNVVHINSVDVRGQLNKMAGALLTFDAFVRQKSAVVGDNPLGGLGKTADAKMEVEKINRDLDAIKDMLIESSSYIREYQDDFEKFRQKVKDYENMDDEMKTKIKALYEDLADIQWWQTTTAKFVAGAFLIIAAAAIVIFAPATVGFAGLVTAMAKGIVSFGLLEAGVSFIGACLSGDDIEDSVATGLFMGAMEGALVAGAGHVGTMLGGTVAKTKTVGKVLASKDTAIKAVSRWKNPKVSKVAINIIKGVNTKNITDFLSFNTEYFGHVAFAGFKQQFNGDEVKWKDNFCKTGIKHMFKGIDKLAMKDISNYKLENVIKEKTDIELPKEMIKVGKKVMQYSTKGVIYAAQTSIDSLAYSINDVMKSDSSLTVTDLYDMCTGDYDGVKLSKYVLKDDVKKLIKANLKNVSDSLKREVVEEVLDQD